MIHVCLARFSNSTSLERTDLVKCSKTKEVSEKFLADSPLDFDFKIMKKAKDGCISFSAGIDNIVGLGMLILSGENLETEQEFCHDFQKRIYSPYWSLPVPPLEISPRPMVYYVVFHMRNKICELAKRAEQEILLYGNGIVSGFLKSQRRIHDLNG